jgi:hypothetical protein
MKTTSILTLALLLAGCTVNQSGAICQGLADGGSGGSDSPGKRPPVEVGFGAYGPPCVDGSAEMSHSESDLFDVASLPIKMPFAGTVVSVAVVHQLAGIACEAGGRDVLVSEPTPTFNSIAKGLHERLTFTADDVLSAQLYSGFDNEDETLSVELTRTLAKPMHAKAGMYVHLGSVLGPGVCAAACDSQVGGANAPLGSAVCADGQAWGSCVVNASFAYVGWIEVVPD